MKSKKQLPPLSTDIKQQIVEYWRRSQLNSIATIAKEFNTSAYHAGKSINEYLSTKIIN